MVALIATACAAQTLTSVDEASAASYFCSPAPIKIGSYRPTGESDLDIKVRLTDPSPFWFDDQTGDYIGYANGVAGPRQPAKLHIPVVLRASSERLEFQVAATFAAGQCLVSEMGVVPSDHRTQP